MHSIILKRSAARLGLWFRGKAGELARSRAGVAAVEFALILPVMVLMLLGVTEVGFGVTTDRKLTLLSRSLADLTGRVNSVSSSEMSAIFAAATTILQPYDSTNLEMVMSSVIVTKVNNLPVGTVAWSCAQGPSATKRNAGTLYTVPAGFEGSPSFVVAETNLPYTPMFGYTFTGTMQLRQTTPWPVRNATTVTGPASC